MSSIGITTLGMFDGPHITTHVGGGVIVKEKDTIPKPNILVKDVDFKKSMYKENVIREFVIVKSVK